jgi:putative membrane protein
MMVSNRSPVFGLLAWQWRNSLLFVATGALAQAIYLIPRWTHLSLPPTPIAVIGGAIGIFVSFRSNHGYAWPSAACFPSRWCATSAGSPSR